MDLLFTAITSLGIGGLATAIVAHYLARNKEIDFKKHEQKERRYRSALLFMDAYFEPQNIRFFSNRSDLSPISSPSDVLEHLKAEYHEMILYTPRSVLMAVKNFIENPTRESFLSTILEMRKDLWINKKDVEIEDVKINFPKR